MVRDGKVIGKHRGYPFYTIGQRRGLGLATGEPVYVTGSTVNGTPCRLIRAALYIAALRARRQLHEIREAAGRVPGRCQDPLQDGGGPGRVLDGDRRAAPCGIRLNRAGPCTGQSVVLYEGTISLGEDHRRSDRLIIP